MLNAILVDDEKPALDLLCRMLEGTGHYRIAGVFLHPGDVEIFLESQSPDVAFLDVEMPETSGIALANRMKQRCPEMEIVFVTAYSHHALAAYQVQAIGYLVKPVHARELSNITERLLKVCRKTDGNPASWISIRLFNRLEVLSPKDGKSIKWRTLKTEELFAFLYLHRGASVHREKIMEALWPEHAPDRALALLHTTIYQMKKSLRLGGIPFSLTNAIGSYQMNIPDMTSDIQLFNVLTNVKPSLDMDSMAQADSVVGLYRGNLLEENGYSWDEPFRHAYQTKITLLAIQIAEAHAERNEPGQVEWVLKQVLEVIPWQETLHEKLLQHFLIQGNQSAFLVQYRKMELSLREELGIEPSIELQNVHRCIERDYHG